MFTVKETIIGKSGISATNVIKECKTLQEAQNVMLAKAEKYKKEMEKPSFFYSPFYVSLRRGMKFINEIYIDTSVPVAREICRLEKNKAKFFVDERLQTRFSIMDNVKGRTYDSDAALRYLGAIVKLSNTCGNIYRTCDIDNQFLSTPFIKRIKTGNKYYIAIVDYFDKEFYGKADELFWN